MRALVLLLGLSSLLVSVPFPLAAAQGSVESRLAVALSSPGGGLVPGVASVSFLVTVRYETDPGAVAGPGAATTVRFEVEQAPTWLRGARFEPPEVRIAPSPLGGGASRNVSLFLVPEADAPGGEPAPFVVRATAEPNGNVLGATARSVEQPVRVRVLREVHVEPPPEGTTFLRGGRWSEVPFLVRNEGNAPAALLLDVATRPEESQVELPFRALDLAPEEARSVPVRVRAPWTHASEGPLELEVRHADAEADEAADRAGTDLRVRSAAPLEPGSAVAGLGLAAIASGAGRNRRKPSARPQERAA